MLNFTFRLWALLVLGFSAGAAQAQRLAAGATHTLSIHPDGTLWAWGSGGNGQLGTGAVVQPSPAQVSAATWQSVAAGQNSSAAIRTDGTLWTWGYNANGQLGDGTTTTHPTPVQVGTATTWRSVSVGSQHVVAVRQDGTLWAWGSNSYGQLGNGTTTTQLTPVQVGTATTWASVSAGANHTLALRTDGTLWAWGYNSFGQLGQGPTANQPAPVQVGTAATWASAAAGGNHSLAVRQDGTLWAWGYNSSGQLGIGTLSITQNTLVQVGTATTWLSVAGGSTHSVALRQDGTLWAWGDNHYGQLGNGTTTAQQLTPAPAGTGATWQLATTGANASHTAALRPDGTRWTWGDNRNGQLGNGTTGQAVLAPAQVTVPASWRDVGAGTSISYGLRPDGTLWSWGAGSNGQLGQNNSPADQYTPGQVGTATTWRSVTGGFLHSVALRQDGTLWAWGSSQSGQLGTGTTNISQQPPVQVGTDTNWQSVATGYSHTVAVRQDGTLWAWGSNTYGQLGLGTTTNQLTPAQVGTASNWRSVAAGYFGTVAVRQDGTLWAWGDNTYGQLGDGTTTQQNSPRQVGTATTWLSASAGNYHLLALRQDGTLWAWGDNRNGQLGLGTTTQQLTPAQVGTATTWASVAGGSAHTVALRQDGTLWAWGSNSFGQLGQGPTTLQSVPAQVGTAAWQRVAAGQYHTLAVRQDGTLWAWGSNSYGQTAQFNGNPVPLYIPYPAAPLATTGATTTEWALAPNPAHGRAQLLGLPAGPVAGQLFDAQGRLVRTISAAEVELAGLAPGLYLLRAAAGGTTRTLRLVVE